MMFLKDTFFILHETTMKFRIIELPYVKNELSMFVLLPDDISDNTTGLELVKLTYCCITYIRVTETDEKSEEEQASKSQQNSANVIILCFRNCNPMIFSLGFRTCGNIANIAHLKPMSTQLSFFCLLPKARIISESQCPRGIFSGRLHLFIFMSSSAWISSW